MNKLNHIVASLFCMEKRFCQKAKKSGRLELETLAKIHGCELNMVLVKDWDNVHPLAQYAKGYPLPYGFDESIGFVVDYREDYGQAMCAFEILCEVYYNALNYVLVSEIWNMDLSEEAKRYIAHHLAFWVLLLETNVLHIVI